MNTRLVTFCAVVLFLHLGFAVAQTYLDPKSCPPNENYKTCGPDCQTECATLNEPCSIRHIRCPDGCYCNDGYARNAKGHCIPIDKC